MKELSSRRAGLFPRIFYLCALAIALAGVQARAGLTIAIDVSQDNYGYYFYPFLNANTNLPTFPDGIYQVASPQIPTSGSRTVYQASGGNISECYNNDCGGATYYNSFDSLVYGITNGLWTITITNNSSSNVYFFSVTMSGVTSNTFGAALEMIYPRNGAVDVPNQPEFQWMGPANWAGTLYVEDDSVDSNGNSTYVTGQYLSPDSTSWTPESLLPDGTNSLYVDYLSNATAQIIASQPTNSAGQPISAWVSTATVETRFTFSPLFTVGQAANDYDGFLVARYNFENTNWPGMDSSGSNNNANCGSSSGPMADVPSTNAAVGQYARQYFGQTAICFVPGYSGYTALSNGLSQSFSVTAWVQTTNSINGDTANAYFGQPVFFAYDNSTNGTVPMSITGSKAAFTVSNPDGTDTTIHSVTSVNDGNYHFIAVTRCVTNGLMSLYVDGNLEATGICNTASIDSTSTMYIAGGYYNFVGLLDDIRIYSTNLSAADVANIASGGNLPSIGAAIGVTNLTVTTSGDADWFVETTNTYNGAPAADESGSISNYQSSTLTITVTGPGKLTFNWSSDDNDPNQDMDYEFAIDDVNTNDIADLYGAKDWQSIETSLGSSSPIEVPPGQHTLIWTVYANYDADPSEAGFLDQVVFTPPDTNPVSANITLNIYREQDPTFGDIYIAFPSFNSVTPSAADGGSNTLYSPNGYFNTTAGGGASSAILTSLDDVLNECTNGLWSLNINQGLPNGRQFQFSATVSGLTTNLLAAVELIAPTNGATNFSATGTIQWLGPTNDSTLSVSEQQINGAGYVSTNPPVTTTNWTPPPFTAGTNRCDITYTSNNFPGMTFSVPVDTVDAQTVSNWTTQVNLNSTATAIFVVSSGPSPVTLLSAKNNGTNFQFSFQSQAGFTNTIEYRTNLVLGSWQSYSNVPGDGTLKTIPIPYSLFSPSKQGFIRVSTQ